MKNELWLIWKDPVTRRRYRVGTLTKNDENYVFRYTNPELNDAIDNGFEYFPGFKDIDKTYVSEKLFANILTRLPNKNRPDYLEILNAYNLESNSTDFEILKATKGRLITDSYEFVPAFDLDRLEFDVAGTNYSSDINLCKKLLKINDKLYLEPELNNKYDENAIRVVYTNLGKKYYIGYVPRYYSKQLLDALKSGTDYSAMIKSLNFESELSDEYITTNVKIIFNV